eukprot:9473955-Pyramimonas_sp.AAC.1
MSGALAPVICLAVGATVGLALCIHVRAPRALALPYHCVRLSIAVRPRSHAPLTIVSPIVGHGALRDW